ncbi:acyltransferase family protein [Croceicoccus mobilis]|uniref:Acyltransferase n=1 Tax=Croceicoccus mobilis TaxID=1703339 RepID=A0A917DQM1_9SPHN|nr:acyltransferase family protein [Croceicoccus mobilis]GGD60357.1 acyltransferase [Croceicoccus mobilis]
MQSKYRPDIDGLRTIAVVPVVLFHAGLGPSGGFVGVDIFFVISGYLITMGLLSDNERGIFSIARFYERRIRRILPALTVVALATLLAGAFIMLPSEFDALGASTLSTALFYSNIHFWAAQSYFAAENLTNPLLHTWSLSVEEQFYIVWPVAIWAIYKLRLDRFLPQLMVLGIVATLIATEVMLGYSAKTAFYMAPLRAWELMMGALLATGKVPQVKSPAMAQGLSVLALGLIAWSLFTLTEASRFPGISAAPACIGSALLIHLGGPDRSIGGRLLALKPMVWIGLISYSLYLWHWPIFSLFTLAKGAHMSVGEGLALSALSVLLAWASLRFIEKPFRRPPGSKHQRGGADWPLLARGAAVLVAIGALGTTIMLSDGFPSRVPEQVARIDAQQLDVVNVDVGCMVDSNMPADLAQSCFSTPAERQASVAVWGDSFARQYANEMMAHYRAAGDGSDDAMPLMLMATGCTPISGVTPTFGLGRVDERCKAFSDFAADSLESMPELKHLIIAGRWSNLYAIQIPGEIAPPPTARFYLSDAKPQRTFDNTMAQMEQSLERLVLAMQDKGVSVTIIAEPPRYSHQVKSCAARAAWNGEEPGIACATTTGQQREFHKPVEKMLEGLAARHANVTLYDPLTRFCGNGDDALCKGYADGELLAFDNDHLTTAGSYVALKGFDWPSAMN